jgi:hypothetical protein
MATTSNSGGFMNALRSPEGIAAATTGGLGLIEGILRSKGDAKQAAAEREMRMRELLNGIGRDEQANLFDRQRAYLDSTQMDPAAQARHLFSASALGDLAGRGATRVGPGGVQNPFRPSAQTQGFVGPEALAEHAARFYGAAGSINPAAARPDLSAMGFGQAGAARQGQVTGEIDAAGQQLAALNSQRRSDLLGSLQGGGQGPVTQNGPQLDGMNDQMRTSAAWQDWMRQQGEDPARVSLNDSQRRALQAHMAANGIQFGPGMEIDPAGNVNQDQGVSRYARTAGKIGLMAAPFALMAVPGLQGAGMAAMLGRAGASAGLGYLGGGARGAAVGAASSLGGDYFTRPRVPVPSPQAAPSPMPSPSPYTLPEPRR